MNALLCNKIVNLSRIPNKLQIQLGIENSTCITANKHPILPKVFTKVYYLLCNKSRYVYETQGLMVTVKITMPLTYVSIEQTKSHT